MPKAIALDLAEELEEVASTRATPVEDAGWPVVPAGGEGCVLGFDCWLELGWVGATPVELDFPVELIDCPVELIDCPVELIIPVVKGTPVVMQWLISAGHWKEDPVQSSAGSQGAVDALHTTPAA